MRIKAPSKIQQHCRSLRLVLPTRAGVALEWILSCCFSAHHPSCNLGVRLSNRVYPALLVQPGQDSDVISLMDYSFEEHVFSYACFFLQLSAL